MTKLQDSQAGSVSPARELRQHPRRKLAGMAYVELAQDNGGILLNLSEGGLAIQSALALSSTEFPDLRFQLPNMRGWLTGSGRAVWMSESKKEAGIQFLDLHEHARAQIRMWVAKEGVGEPETVGSADAGTAEYASPAAHGSNRNEPANGVHTNSGPRARVERLATGRLPENHVAAARHSETPAGQDERNFRFHDYSMFAADANAGVPWIEPVKQRRSWGSYVLFTILLAALFFVLGAMIGRDNLNGLVSSVEGWKGVQGEAPPSAKPPAPPETSESSASRAGEATSSTSAPSTSEGAPSGQPSTASSGASRGENAGQASSMTPEEKNPASGANDQASTGNAFADSAGRDAGGAGSSAAAVVPPAKTGSASESRSASAPKERSANKSKGPTLRPDASYSNADLADTNEYGRSILVNAPAPGGPPFFVNLPGEPVSASSSVAISARRSIQVPPRADAGAYGSERLIIGKLLAHSDPFYPAEAEAKRIEGIVELHALVGRSGQVISVTPVSGPGVLVAAGATALHEWRYEPTFINGDPVETHVDVTMVFRSR